MRVLYLTLICGLAIAIVSGKRVKNVKHHEKAARVTKNSKPQNPADNKGSKKQLLGYPEPDGREQGAAGDFGQGGPPGPGLGGLGRGGLGEEIEGMPVGMGAGGDPMGYREQQEGIPGPNFHVPGIAGPSSFPDNAEVGRNNDDDNPLVERYRDSEDVDSMTQRAITKINGVDENNQGQNFGRNDMYSDEEPDESVTKAIGRPFEPEGGPVGGGNMDEHEDSPFQAVKQENPFQIPMNNIAAQASFAHSQMSRFRPESAAALGQQQEETPFQPQGEQGPEDQEYDGQEGAQFSATPMNGGEAIMRMGEQEGMKRHYRKALGKKGLLKSMKRKRILKQVKPQLKKKSSGN